MSKVPVIKISTLNCNGLGKKHKEIFYRLGFNKFKRSYHSDVFPLQETHLKDEHDLKDEWMEKYKGKNAFFARGYTTEGRLGVGVAILLGKADIFTEIKLPRIIEEGRAIRLDLKIKKQPFTIISVYAPTGKQERAIFFEKLHESLKDIPYSNNIIFGGDFNCVENKSLDRENLDAQDDVGIKELQFFNRANFLTDPFRENFPKKKIFTYKGWKGKRSRLDRIYISKQLSPNTKFDCRHLYQNGPDHLIWTTTFELKKAPPENPEKHKNPYFRFNNKFLNPEFNRGIEETFERIATLDFENSKLKWKATKNLLASYSKRFGYEYARKKREEANRKPQLEQDLIKELQSLNPNRVLIEDLSSEISVTEEEEAKKFAFLSKVETYQNEMSTPAFLRTLKKRKKATSIDTLENPTSGTKTKDPGEILEGIHEFYQDLFDEHPDEVSEQMMNSLLNYQTKQVDSRFLRALESPLTKSELSKAIDQLAKNRDKAPGIDGLTAEFYSKHKEYILPDLLKASEEIIKEMRLDNQQSTAVIVLIFKKGLEHFLKNYRPISLLPLDYKIIAKALANRLISVLPSLISEEQTAGVPGRSITESTNLIRDVVDYATDQNQPCILLSLDMEKAFDRVSHTFLIRVLKSMGFPTFFINCIKTLYNEVTCCVRNNGKLTRHLNFKRGARQGCPLSPLLFTIVGETLMQAIKSVKNFKGILVPRPLGDPFAEAAAEVVADLVAAAKPVVAEAEKERPRELRVSAFADDLVFFIRVYSDPCYGVCIGSYNCADTSLNAFYDILSIYCKASGAKLNISKCKGVTFGAKPEENTLLALAINAARHFDPNEIQLTSIKEAKGVYILGINYHPNRDTCIKNNYEDITAKISKQIEWLRSRRLSYKGRVVAANATVLSKLWGTAATISFFYSVSGGFEVKGVNYVKKIENLIDNFIMVTNHANTGPANKICRFTQAKKVDDGGWGRQLIIPKVLSLQAKQLLNTLDPGNKKISTLFTRHFLAGRIMDPPNIPSGYQQPDLLEEHPRRINVPLMHKSLEELYKSNRSLFSPKVGINPIYHPLKTTSKLIYQTLMRSQHFIPTPSTSDWITIPWETSYKLYTNLYKQDTFYRFRHCKLLLHSALLEPCIFCEKNFTEKGIVPSIIQSQPKPKSGENRRKLTQDGKIFHQRKITQDGSHIYPDGKDKPGKPFIHPDDRIKKPAKKKIPTQEPEQTGDPPHFHTFYGCDFVSPIWVKVIDCLRKIDPKLDLNVVNHTNFLTGVKGKTPKAILINTIINIVIYHIWDWRCNKKHGRQITRLGNTCKSYKGVLKRIIYDTKKTLLVQYHILKKEQKNLDVLAPILTTDTRNNPQFNFDPP